MKPLFKTLTHLAAAALGMALAVTAPGLFRSAPDPATEDGAARQGEGNDDARSSRKAAARPASEGRAAEFRRAWKALASRPMSADERRVIQGKLLEQWAEVDLPGAMEAFIGEAWDGVNDPFGGSGGHPLSGAFAKAFAERPLEAWKLISSGKLGVGSQIFRRDWLNAVAPKDGMLVASMLGEFPPSLQADAIRRVIDAGGADPRARDALLKKIAGGGSPEQVAGWLQTAFASFPAGGDSAQLRARWNALPNGSDRTLALTAWAASLRTADTEAFAAEWENVPESARGDAAKSVLSQLVRGNPALTIAIDNAIEAGEWDYLEKSVADKLRGVPNPKELAEWAMTLPARKEATDLYHRAMEEYLTREPEAGRQWLESLPEGDWHRERGFVELSQSSLWRRNDPAASLRAIESITDPLARQIARTYRYDWELLTEKPVITRE